MVWSRGLQGQELGNGGRQVCGPDTAVAKPKPATRDRNVREAKTEGTTSERRRRKPPRQGFEDRDRRVREAKKETVAAGFWTRTDKAPPTDIEADMKRSGQTTNSRSRKKKGRPDPLQEIPGVGPALSEDLRDLGFREVTDLKGQDPELMFARLNHLRGSGQDRCVLYVFRCAVYFASTERPEADLLKWWFWKDSSIRERDQREPECPIPEIR